MAYVVARPKGRFEIRESAQTPKGPRAKTLANFGQLTPAVIETASGRARTPFDAQSVITSARRAGAPITTGLGSSVSPAHERFVASSRRMAASLGQPDLPAGRSAGDVLVDLLAFADALRAARPEGAPVPLGYPSLKRLADH